MRSLLQSVQESFGQRRRNLRSVQVTIAEESGPCPRCGGAMGVQKTARRCGRTLEHGSFEARESVYVCLAGCRQPSLEASLTLAPEALISIGVATKDTELLLRGCAIRITPWCATGRRLQRQAELLPQSLHNKARHTPAPGGAAH